MSMTWPSRLKSPGLVGAPPAPPGVSVGRGVGSRGEPVGREVGSVGGVAVGARTGTDVCRGDGRVVSQGAADAPSVGAAATALPRGVVDAGVPPLNNPENASAPRTTTA